MPSTYERRKRCGCGQEKASRILIVEDDFLIAMELESLLLGYGFAVLGSVSTIERALAFIESERPDMVLLDVDLHGRRSTPVAAALRACGVPFVLVTGCSRKQLGEPELQGVPLVGKPVAGDALSRALTGTIRDDVSLGGSW
jgi:two-component system, response regulator PdtaR